MIVGSHSLILSLSPEATFNKQAPVTIGYGDFELADL